MQPRLLNAKDLMTRSLLTVRPTMGMQELMDFFRDNKIHGALVEDGGRLLGVVSMTDLLVHLSEEADDGQPFWRQYTSEDHPEFLERIPEGLNDVSVDDLMTPNVVTCEVDDTVGKVAKIMREESIHRLVVLEKGNAVGLISSTDLLRAVSEYEHALSATVQQ